ncbi:unnamed protein product [Calypogeia fissa]
MSAYTQEVLVSVEKFLADLEDKIDRERRMAYEAKIAELFARNRALHKELTGLKKESTQSQADLRKKNRQLQREVTNLKKRLAQSRKDLKRNRRKRHRLRKRRRTDAQGTYRLQNGSSTRGPTSEKPDSSSDDSDVGGTSCCSENGSSTSEGQESSGDDSDANGTVCSQEGSSTSEEEESSSDDYY